MFAVDTQQEGFPRTLKKGANYYAAFVKEYFSTEQEEQIIHHNW